VSEEGLLTAARVVWTWYGKDQVEFHAAAPGELPPTVQTWPRPPGSWAVLRLC
jgi:hypothetical protein